MDHPVTGVRMIEHVFRTGAGLGVIVHLMARSTGRCGIQDAASLRCTDPHHAQRNPQGRDGGG
jgi:hypothetical protein